jgi:hypothetical protein
MRVGGGRDYRATTVRERTIRAQPVPRSFLQICVSRSRDRQGAVKKLIQSVRATLCGRPLRNPADFSRLRSPSAGTVRFVYLIRQLLRRAGT